MNQQRTTKQTRDFMGTETLTAVPANWARRCSFWAPILIFLLLAVTATSPLFAGGDQSTGGDAATGRLVMERSGCSECHSINGHGNDSAGDLVSRSIRHRQSPAGTAAKMWNHAPEMWELMSERRMETLEVSRSDAEDIFAFFRSSRYFELWGEVIRGKKVFSDKGCANCHQLTHDSGREASGPPVSQWKTHLDTSAWTSSLWNHAGAMIEEMNRSGIDWPTLTEQEMTDLLLYLRTLPGSRGQAIELALTDPAAGLTVFDDWGCGNCHSLDGTEPGKRDLTNGTRDARTMSGLATAMWNHIPDMLATAAEGGVALAPLTSAQVTSIASTLYFAGYFSENGSASKGQRVFTKKGCSTCHEPSAQPLWPSDGPRLNAAGMTATVWTHGPGMLAEMNQSGVEWPTFSEKEMEDLIAFLNDEYDRAYYASTRTETTFDTPGSSMVTP